MKNPIYGGWGGGAGGGGVGGGRRLPKKGDLDSLQIYDGAWQKGGEWYF